MAAGALIGWTLSLDPGGMITGVEGSGDSRIVTVSAPVAGTYNLDVVPGGIADIAGNALSGAAPSGADESYTVGARPPLLAIAVPPDVSAEATAITTAVVLGTANSTGGSGNVTITNDALDMFLLGNTTVTWTAAANGDAVRDTQIVTVLDTTPPTIGAMQDRSAAFRSGQTFTVNYDAPEASDIADPLLHVSCNPPSGSTFALGENTVTCTVSDNTGNTASVEFTVTVSLSSPSPNDTVLFFDNFEDGNLNGWTARSDFYTWNGGTLDDNVVPAGHPTSNKVAEADECDTGCTLEMTSGVSIPAGSSNSNSSSSSSGTAILQFYRYVDELLDPGEYFRVDAYNGTGWTQLDSWTPEESENDGLWHFEAYDLSGYAGVSDFKVRFAAMTSTLQEDVAIDDVRIFVPAT